MEKEFHDRNPPLGRPERDGRQRSTASAKRKRRRAPSACMMTGCIGVAGCLGTPGRSRTLTKHRRPRRSGTGIPYPCEARRRSASATDLHEEEIIPVSGASFPTMQAFLDRTRRSAARRFAFSNKIRMTHMKDRVPELEGSATLSRSGQRALEMTLARAEPRVRQHCMDSVSRMRPATAIRRRTTLLCTAQVSSTTLTTRPPISSPAFIPGRHGSLRPVRHRPYSILSARCTSPARRSSAGSSARRSSRISCPSATT